MKRLQFSSYQASTTFSISVQTSLSHSPSLSPCHFILYDVRAMARQTVADKIGQLRHLRERGFGLARKHVRILPSTALNFSPFASVFVWGNGIGQVADKWQGGEGKRDIDSHFTMSHEADKSPPPFFRVCRTMCQGCYLCPVSIKCPVKHTHLCEMLSRHSFNRKQSFRVIFSVRLHLTFAILFPVRIFLQFKYCLRRNLKVLFRAV